MAAQWVAVLRSIEADTFQREKARSALVAMGRPVVPALIEALAHDHAAGAAAGALAQIGPDAEEATPALLRCLRERRAPFVARYALERIGTRSFTPYLELLDHPSSEVRIDGLHLLGIYELPAEVVERIAQCASDADPSVRTKVMWGLGRERGHPSIAVPALVNALGDADEDVIAAAFRGLQALGPAAAPAVPALVARLDTTDLEVRRDVVGTLEAIGPAAAPAESQLILIAESSDEHDSRLALDAIAALGPASLVKAAESPVAAVRAGAVGHLVVRADRRAYADLILGALGDPDASLRSAAAPALELAPGIAEGRVELLQGLADDPDPGIRAGAMASLAHNWAKGHTGPDRLLRGLDDPSLKVAETAAEYLAVIVALDPATVVLALRRAWSRDDVEIERRLAMWAALVRADREADEAWSWMAETLRTAKPAIKEKIAWRLGGARDPRALDLVLTQLDGESRTRRSEVRCVMVKALGRIGTRDTRALPALVAQSTHHQEDVRCAAVLQLSAFRDRPDVRKALERARRDSSAAVRSRAIAALGDD